ncbi:hypothetical protein NYS48_09790 [Curtobacterium flaccumfaciens pv. flaccumfaciens]|uniref:hypothetical protein n=1 Tax=Curtobacterium poinsettiae TaxID=159612 RepID=UPI00217DF0ED|nr:hypothetical protein [Curtobacterium flaccumfaciens]MCS6565604.1 hypothetical protein [Curtobacterium flaccumfaciens pv. flaccumfaciens]
MGKSLGVTAAQKPSDPTIGGKQVQKVQANTWFQGLNVFGNNTGLAPDPRQPTQFNVVIDGSTLDRTTYGTNKTGFVNNIGFKGGYDAESATPGLADPRAIFGEVVFTYTGKTAGDLSGIDAYYAQTSEAHMYTPGAQLGTMIGLETSIGAHDSAVGAKITNAYGLFARGPSDDVGDVITNAYSAYFEAPRGGTNRWAIRSAGKAQFDAQAFFAGPVPQSGTATPGTYIGRDSGSGSTIDFVNGTTDIQIGNSLSNQFEVRLAGTRVLMALTQAGQMNMDGTAVFGRGTVTPVPASQGIAKGAYLGRASNGTVGLDLSDGTNTVRVANDGSGNIVFQKSGVATLATINSSGDFIAGKGLAFSPTTQTTAPVAGGASALPTTPAGYAQVTIGGTPRWMPYY